MLTKIHVPVFLLLQGWTKLDHVLLIVLLIVPGGETWVEWEVYILVYHMVHLVSHFICSDFATKTLIRVFSLCNFTIISLGITFGTQLVLWRILFWPRCALTTDYADNLQNVCLPPVGRPSWNFNLSQLASKMWNTTKIRFSLTRTIFQPWSKIKHWHWQQLKQKLCWGQCSNGQLKELPYLEENYFFCKFSVFCQLIGGCLLLIVNTQQLI